MVPGFFRALGFDRFHTAFAQFAWPVFRAAVAQSFLPSQTSLTNAGWHPENPL
jgi:hypothetical protein